jgi:hypothetical protein
MNHVDLYDDPNGKNTTLHDEQKLIPLHMVNGKCGHHQTTDAISHKEYDTGYKIIVERGTLQHAYRHV